MFPHFNPHLHNPGNQLQANGANASAPQQVMGSAGNFYPNPMQIRPQFQMGMLNNPQLAMSMPPFINPNSYIAPTQFFPFPQGALQNFSNNNLPQLLGYNAVNLPQFLPNGQLKVPNLVQNVNQLLHVQMPNSGPPNSGPLLSARPQMVNGNGIMQSPMDGNALKHMGPNIAATKDFGSPQTQRNQNVFSPGAAKTQSNAGVINGVDDRKNNFGKSHNKNFIGNPRHDASKRGSCQRQFHHRQKPPGNFKFNNQNQRKGKKTIGVKDFTSSNSFDQIQVGKRRSAVLNYTEQEIQQWREQRRKNYPTNANMEKKLCPRLTEAEDEVTKIRRKQLKEILAKQAELGCEVAEIPSCYLYDAEQQTDARRQNNSKVFGKRERFPNKFDRTGRFHQNDRFSKRQRSVYNDSVNEQGPSSQFTNKQRSANGFTANMHTDHKREPSLLKKLLTSDIKRDKKHLLQVFRFMVMNSFFQNCPEAPLKFPVVIVKELGDRNEIEEEKPESSDDSSRAEAGVEKHPASCSRGNAVTEEDEGENP